MVNMRMLKNFKNKLDKVMKKNINNTKENRLKRLMKKK